MGAVTLPRLRNSGEEVKDIDGMLVCSCMGYISFARDDYRPCKHVFEAIKHDLDAQAVHQARNVDVPMWGKPIAGKFFVVRLQVSAADAVRGMVPFFAGTDKLGYLDSSEGRRAMRAVTYEWLRSKYREVGPCMDPMHSMNVYYPFSQRERVRLDSDSTKPEILASVASILSDDKRRCWMCYHRNDDDLVPDI